MGSIVILYVCGVSEKIRKIAATFGLRTAFHSCHMLGRILSGKKPSNSVFDTKIIYSACVSVVLCMWACCPLQVCWKKHKLIAQRGNTMKLRLAEHVRESQLQFCGLIVISLIKK